MNKSLQQSIDFANRESYLDELFQVYPTIPDGIREINQTLWNKVEQAFNQKDDIALIKSLLKMDIFPIKDSYVAYLKRDKTSIEKNPNTIERLAGRIYELGLDKIYEKCSEPKETNRQIGPMFKSWINSGALGMLPVELHRFMSSNENAILNGSDKIMMDFAKGYLNYHHNKGLDFVARFNGKYVIGEAKFLSDFGGHQNAQFNDAISTIEVEGVNAVKIAILDGVLYIPGNNKMYKAITHEYKDYNIMSALVLREFLYQL